MITPQAGPPPQEALDYFRSKGLAVGFDYRDVWRQEHAVAFTVAKAMTYDVLTAIRGEVDRALAEGRTYREFEKDMIPRLQQLGWWGKQNMIDPKTGLPVKAQLGSPRRLKTIYRANLRTARAAGQWERAQRTKEALPYFEYLLGPSERHRDEHAAIAGTILPVDDPFWDSHYPPNGWGCKCHLRQITRQEATRKGGESHRPNVPEREWLNKRTGEVERLPQGIDPGWDTSPGKARAEQANRKLDQSEKAFNEAFPAKRATTNIPSSGKAPVSSAIQVRARGVAGTAAKQTIAAIDAIHDDGLLPKLPLGADNKGSNYGTYFFTAKGAATRITLNGNGPWPKLSAAHEIGHFLDHQALGNPGDFASSSHLAMARWREAVVKSDAVKILRKQELNTSSPREKSYYKYMLRQDELWARSYAQYIATRSKDTGLREQLKSAQAESGRQWTDEDFIPIAEAIDDLFKSKGWIQ